MFMLSTDHLRVCGADGTVDIHIANLRGSPPRVRSRRNRVSVAQQHLGITSACAEQTTAFKLPAASARDHLRVCGADGVDSMPPV